MTLSRVGVGIDCQNGFASKDGGLYVPGADLAMEIYGNGVAATPKFFDEWVLSFDWHPRNHFMSADAARIGDDQGVPVGGYTPVTRSQVHEGEFAGIHPADESWLKTYVDKLYAAGKKDLMVWNGHCVAGTWDAELYHSVERAVDVWEAHHSKRVYRHYKGLCPEREQYGAFGDEVPNRAGIMSFDTDLVRYILSFDEKHWAGLVLSHCLMASFDQAMSLESSRRYFTHTIWLDCTAIVPGFEEATRRWLAEWQKRGVKVTQMADQLKT